MALQLVVDSIDTIPEALRGEYVAKDGKFHLSVDGIEDTTGLKNALAAERKRAGDLEKQTKAWAKLGKTPDEIAEMTAAAEKAAEDALKKAGNHEEILNKKLAALAKERDERETKLTGERDAALSSERQAIVETRVNSALVKAKATTEGLDLLTDRLGKRLAFEVVDGKRSISILAADGTPMIGSGKDGLATMDDLVKEAVKQYPSLFEGSGAGGSGKDPNNNRRDAGAKTISLADFKALGPIEKAAKMKEGFKVVD
jgi:hypothetical protein